MSDDLTLIRTAGRQIPEAVQGIRAPDDKKKENESKAVEHARKCHLWPRGDIFACLFHNWHI